MENISLHLSFILMFLICSWLFLRFLLFLNPYGTISTGAFMNTSWENPSGHRAISYEENLSFILSVFFRENLSFLYGKSFVQTQLFSSLFSLFYQSAVHILFCSVQDSFVVRKKWWRSCCLSIKLLCRKVQLRSVILKYFILYSERILVWLYSECHCEQNYVVCRLWTRCCSELWTGAYSWVEREREIL